MGKLILGFRLLSEFNSLLSAVIGHTNIEMTRKCFRLLSEFNSLLYLFNNDNYTRYECFRLLSEFNSF